MTIKNTDGSWDSDKTEIDEIGDIIEVKLENNKNNIFEIIINDDKGNTLECEPSEFVISSRGIGPPPSTLTYNYGIEIGSEGRVIFDTINGLQKNQKIKLVYDFWNHFDHLEIAQKKELNYVTYGSHWLMKEGTDI